MKKIRNISLLIFLVSLLCSCDYRGSIYRTKTISRHYTLKNGHASLSADDYGEAKFITSIEGENIVYTQYCDFDSFYYFETEESTIATYHKGFSDYIDISDECTFINFHYDGKCEYKITLIDGSVCSENNGIYRFIDDDNIVISFDDNSEGTAITRFGLEHEGIGKGKITYLRFFIDLNIDGNNQTIYFWFYDTILHPSPWSET